MTKRNIVLLIVALCIAAFTSMALRTRIQTNNIVNEPKQVEVSHRVLVATHDIGPGSFVRAGQDIDWANMPENAIPEGAIQEGSDVIGNFDGAVARKHLRAKEPISNGALIKRGAGGFLSAVLEPGKRAVSIAVTAISGNAGFIFPGDRVDVIITHKVKVGGNGAEEAVISETFAENIRVVAVDQSMDNPENKAILAKTITVEATPKEAEKIQLATELGKISFVLRSLSDTATKGVNEDGTIADVIPDTLSQSYTRDFEVSPSLARGSGAHPKMNVIRGDQKEQLDFYGGAQ